MTPAQLFSLSGRVALVTGSASGLGYEIARALGFAGAHVVVNGRNADRLAEVVAGLAGEGLSCEAAAFDVVDSAAREQALARIYQSHGRLDILVNNVGMRDRRALADFDDAAIDALVAANLSAAIKLSRQALGLMEAGGWGRLITVTSIAGRLARAGDAVYPATKEGLAGFMRSCAAEYGARGITSNAIAPGFFATDPNLGMVADPDVQAFVDLRIPARRWGRPDEIAGAALFLASEAASFVNGQTLTVDGGMSAQM